MSTEYKIISGFPLSKLLSGEIECPPFVSGVLVDEESFTPPEGVKEIGLLYRSDEDGDLDEDLLDVIISYGLTGVSVIMEIPFEETVDDPSYIMSVASNAGFSISLFPPEVDSEENREAYKERLSEFTQAFLNQKNFAKEIYPITSYLQYMYLENFVDVSNYQATDPYIIQKFVETTTEEFSDEFKLVMRGLVFEHFGGEAEFKEFAKALFYKIYKLTEYNCVDMVESMKSGVTEDKPIYAGYYDAPESPAEAADAKEK